MAYNLADDAKKQNEKGKNLARVRQSLIEEHN